jgi:hypothetical protein
VVGPGFPPTRRARRRANLDTSSHARREDPLHTAEFDLSRALREQELRLVEEFHGRVDDAVVRSQFGLIAAGLRDARVTLYVPVLAYRLTRERLRTRASIWLLAAGSDPTAAAGTPTRPDPNTVPPRRGNGDGRAGTPSTLDDVSAGRRGFMRFPVDARAAGQSARRHAGAGPGAGSDER